MLYMICSTATIGYMGLLHKLAFQREINKPAIPELEIDEINNNVLAPTPNHHL